MAKVTKSETAEAEQRLLPPPPTVEFWLCEELRERCDNDELTANATATLEWLKPALKDQYKSKLIKAAVADLLNVREFTTNLGFYGIFDDLRDFCQEASIELSLDMRDFYRSAGLAKSLGEFHSKRAHKPPVMRQDDPLVGVLEPPRRLGHKPAPAKGRARMMNKAVSKDDHRFKKPPVVMHNIDMVRCAVTFDEVGHLKAMLDDLESEFGPPARDKNMFAFDDTEAEAQQHYRTFMRSVIYAPEGLTFGELAQSNRASWDMYLERPPEDPNEPWAPFRADSALAVKFLRSPEIATRPVRLICEVQCLLQEYLDGRVKMHGLYKIVRAADEHALYSDFKRVGDTEKYPKDATWASIQQESVQEVRRKLEECEDLNCSLNENGITMLLSEANQGHVAAVEFLIRMHADVNKATIDDGATPLFLSADNGHFDIAEVLLEHAADIDRATTDNGVTPLSAAAFKGHMYVIQALLANHANVNKATTDDGRTPLWRAAKTGHIDAVQALLDALADVDKPRTADACSPLFMAVESGHFDVACALMERRANVDMEKLDDGVTPLNMAAFKGDVDVVEVLLLNGADVNKATTEHGTTPLYVAAENGHLAVVQALLREGPEVDQATLDDGMTPLYIAAERGHAAVVKALMVHRADVNKTTTEDGSTPLYVAADNGLTRVVELLLQGGANMNVGLTTDGTTPLFMAAYKNHKDVVQLLLLYRADAHIHCEFGTPLKAAASKGNTEVVALLKASSAF